MNVDQIYRFQRDEAFAKQFTAPSYTTFVAMPFGRTDEYDADNIYRLLKDNVHLRANALRQGLPRPFSPLERASEHKGTALVITELITTRILEDHFFVADLTGNNAGVILETGIALNNAVFTGDTGRILFEQAVRELFAHRLLWTDYRSNVAPGSDSFGHHATELGWRVIEHIWQHDRLMQKPEGTPTGSNM